MQVIRQSFILWQLGTKRRKLTCPEGNTMFKSFFRKHEPSSMMMSVTDERGPVTYQSEDHMSVIFQMYGSVWCKVLPYCVLNTLLVLLIKVAKSSFGIDLTFSDQGHMFMSTMVSVLLVARIRIAVSRYMTARELLSAIMRSSRELVQYLVTFTRYDHSPKAIQWRGKVSSCTVDLLFDLIDVLQSNKQTLLYMQSAHFVKCPLEQEMVPTCTSNANRSLDGLLQQQRNPIAMAIFLRSAIASHLEYLSRPLDVNQELRLLSLTSDFVSAYHGLMKLVTTPFPFPLVQMNRTSLFVWVFSLPFALMSNKEEFFAYLLIFFGTYGFIGLELVSIELDDPFGNDANDINVKSLAQVVFDDIIICLEDIDGKHAASSLRNDFAPRVSATDAPNSRTPLARLKKILSVVEFLNPCATNEKVSTRNHRIESAPVDYNSPNSCQCVSDEDYATVQEQSLLLARCRYASQQNDESIHTNYGGALPSLPSVLHIQLSDGAASSKKGGHITSKKKQHQRKLSLSFNTTSDKEMTTLPQTGLVGKTWNDSKKFHDPFLSSLTHPGQGQGAGFSLDLAGDAKCSPSTSEVENPGWLEADPTATSQGIIRDYTMTPAQSHLLAKTGAASQHDEENIHPNLIKKQPSDGIMRSHVGSMWRSASGSTLAKKSFVAENVKHC